MTSGPLGFPKQARLLAKPDYQRVFAQPSKSFDPQIQVFGRLNGDAPARLGLAISRKAAPRSVDRSRLKRIVRESFRHHRELLVGMDLVVTGRFGLAALSNAELTVRLANHWRRIRTRLCARSSSS